ncbi:MAG: hypothetical protein KAZ26_24235 [Caldilineaceae bacterium]|nr:hypothetical protein [Caldilineaceae bacterium]
MQYRKKPVVIEAMQLTDEMKDLVHNWAGGSATFDKELNPTLTINTLEGNMTARLGDWIIKGIKGEFYPCREDIFLASYEPINEVEEEIREIEVADKIVIPTRAIQGIDPNNYDQLIVNAGIFIDWIGKEKDPDGGPDRAIFNVRYPGGVKLLCVPL